MVVPLLEQLNIELPYEPRVYFWVEEMESYTYIKLEPVYLHSIIIQNSPKGNSSHAYECTGP